MGKSPTPTAGGVQTLVHRISQLFRRSQKCSIIVDSRSFLPTFDEVEMTREDPELAEHIQSKWCACASTRHGVYVRARVLE